MRHWLWFVVAGVIALASLAGAAFYLMPRLATIDEGMVRVVVPGSAVVTLERPGHYLIFHEARSVVDGRVYQAKLGDGVRITLVPEGGGAPVALVAPKMSTEYEIGCCVGRSLLAFDIEHPGRFRLSASRANGPDEAKTVLAVSQGVVGRIFRLILVVFGIASIGIGIAGALVLLVVRARLRARGELL
jgi:hypothetical protein